MTERIWFGVQRLPLKGTSRDERLQRIRDMLSRALNLRTTVAFIGAGCSVPLGYPTWAEFTQRAVAFTKDAIRSLSASGSLEGDLNRLHQFETLLASQDIRPYRFILILGACQKMLFNREGRASYLEFLGRTFEPHAPPSGAPNPYHALLNLPIKRFITTNYDNEIERALTVKRAIPHDELGLHVASAQRSGRQRTFTQQPNYYDQLALFAMSRVEDAENLVFHCHGHYAEPESMIVTEKDYQHWYLGEEVGADAFRQTIELLFSSNPILFVGYGLGDDDLLQSLRMLAAADPDRKHSPPLFALLPEESEGEEEDFHDYLYDRFGLHVIPYLAPNPHTRGQALYDVLVGLEEAKIKWLDEWLEKPMIRKVEVLASPPQRYQHYPPSRRRGPFFGGSRFQKLLADLQQTAEGDARAIALIGPGGTGKSWCAQQLMQRLEDAHAGFDGFFFWSSYYANDSLSGLDRALSYLDPEFKLEGPRLDRFLQCLKQGRYFLVFDGIERLLRESQNSDEGRGYSPGASELLKSLVSPENRSTVLITSRLWPVEFGSPEPHLGVKRVRIQPFTTSDIEAVEPYTWIEDRHRVSALCSLLDGHVYGLAIAAELLRRAGKRNAATRLRELRRVLRDGSPDRRIPRMIREAIRVLDAEWNGLALKLLERLAVFMIPVDKRTLEICYESATVGLPEAAPDWRDALIEELIASKLLQEVVNKRKSPDRFAYTMHPIVRGYIFQRVHHAAADSSPDFTLPGFTAGTAVVDPGGSEGVAVVTDVFERLCHAADEAREQDRVGEAVNLCRNAFGVVRSRMSANTAPRWGDYNNYLRFVLRLGNLCKRVSPQTWDYAERHDVRVVEDWYGPLYADELAWLYNEMGLAYYGEGIIVDAFALWEQGYEINRVIDSYEEGGNYLFQSQCNLGAAYIHLGQLSIAHRFLRDAERTNSRLNDIDHAGRIKGYLALVQHLRGDLKEADEMYQQSLDILKKAGGNGRAESIFFRHWSDLKMKLGDTDQAKLLINSSRSLAEAGRYPELIAYSHLAQGHWFRLQKQYAEALREYNAALREARRIWIRRLESETLGELSRLAYDLGDAQVARQRAIESLQIANKSVLGLRQTHSLVVLGKATIEVGLRGLGIAYLKHARKLAHRQEYWLRANEAEEALYRLGEPVET